MSRFRAPIRRKGDRFVIAIGDDEAAIVRRLVAELRELLTTDEPGDQGDVLLRRLFPVAHPDDPEAEEEYQRLMRDELVQSKLAAFEIVDEALTRRDPVDEGGLLALMQSVNSMRLVLGSMLGVTDDPDVAEVDELLAASPEYQLYGYLSWLLEHCVRAAS